MWTEERLRNGSGAVGRTLWILSLVAVVVAFAAKSAFAQETVEVFDLRGTVVDGMGQPLIGAFVSMTGSEWGSLTDERGRFRIPDVFPGRIELTAEQLGYANLEWAGEVSEASGLLLLRMEAQPVLLEGLTVVTDRFRARRNGTATSVMTFDRTALATSPQESILRFVQARAGLSEVSCPSYTISSTCFYSRGRAMAPVVYIDEQRVLGGLDYLDALRPAELYMVEVYARGRHIRAYTTNFMARAARTRLSPVALLF